MPDADNDLILSMLDRAMVAAAALFAIMFFMAMFPIMWLREMHRMEAVE